MYNSFYTFLSKSFRYEPIRWLKRQIRPLKQALFGKEGVYRAIDFVKNLEHKAGKEVRTVFDIGAADGEYSFVFAKSFPSADVYCFEPQTGSYAKLEKRMATFGNRAKLFKLGFFNKADKMPLYARPSHPDGGSLLPIEGGQATVQRVDLLRLDDFMKQNNVQHIDFLKIDVERVEKEVLEGGLQTLADKVDNVFIEISRNFEDVQGFLYKAGFSLVENMGDENFFFSKLA